MLQISRLRFRGVEDGLDILLHDPHGEGAFLHTGQPARFYHLKVVNRRGWATAKNVRVLVVRIRKPAIDGSLEDRPLPGHIPLNWQFFLMVEPVRTIGKQEAICDLACVRDNNLELTVPLKPGRFEGELKGRGRLVVTVRAVGDNVRSSDVVVDIYWNGLFSQSSEQMAENLKIHMPRTEGSPA